MHFQGGLRDSCLTLSSKLETERPLWKWAISMHTWFEINTNELVVKSVLLILSIYLKLSVRVPWYCTRVLCQMIRVAANGLEQRMHDFIHYSFRLVHCARYASIIKSVDEFVERPKVPQTWQTRNSVAVPETARAGRGGFATRVTKRTSVDHSVNLHEECLIFQYHW